MRGIKIVKFIKSKSGIVFSGMGSRNGELLINRHGSSQAERISSRDLLYNAVTIVNNNILHT